jgi:hypothetical protein
VRQNRGQQRLNRNPAAPGQHPGRGHHHKGDKAMPTPKQLKPSFDRVVQKIEEHPEAAIAALRAAAIRIDTLIEGCDEQSRTDVYNAVWSLLVELKDYACEQAHSARTAA